MVTNGTACSDANACNGLETCQAGACTAGTPLVCNDGNVCTTDGCDPATGCTTTPVANGTSCGDTNLCNGSETCQAGVCAAGTPLVCNDGNVCTTDTCNPASGCAVTAVLNGTPCADGNVCNGAETCQAGVCTAGTPLVCNDGNVCTTDSCAPAFGCTTTPVLNGTSCTDGNICNGAETCQSGVCAPGTNLNCNDSNSCTTDSCNTVSGCAHTPITGCLSCSVAADCNDNNPCTIDTCTGGVCGNAVVTNGTQCNDGNLCNGIETCQSGICTAGTALVCNDTNPCTTDSCLPASGCTGTAVPNGTACPDGNLCNGNETCVGGACTAGTTLVCNDGNPCTTDSCDVLAGCRAVAVANGTTCSDGNVCNGNETCTNGACNPGTPVTCDDANPCTVDSCSALFGCTSLPVLNGTGCSDANACNGAEICQSGVCAPGLPLNCNDGNACTTDSCNPATGCQNLVLPGCRSCSVVADCNDGNACTSDVCVSGACVNTIFPDGTTCSDGNVCNGNEICGGGACLAGTPLVCNDGNVCTTDVCSPTLGCQVTPVANGTPCPDTDACNGAEICVSAVCIPGTAPVCNDNNPCTVDTCDTLLGCRNIPSLDGTLCGDSDICNGVEVCQSANCTSGTPLVCNDGNPCTDDSCNPTTGCTFTNNTAPCDDGLFCTVGELCGGGTCLTGIPRDCSSADNQCNVGVCNEGADACQPAAANEGGTCFTDPCLTGQACTAGTCTGGAPLPPEDCFSARFIVANSGSGNTSVIRSSDHIVEATPITGRFPVGIAVAADTNIAYVTNNVEDTVTAISLDTYSVLANIPVGVNPIGVAVSPNGQWVYVANNADDTISVVSTLTNDVSFIIQLDPDNLQPPIGPAGVAITPNSAFAYVTNNRKNTISVIRISDNVILQEINVGRRPYGITPHPNGLGMFFTNTGDNTVGVIRTIDNAYIGYVRVGAEPIQIAFNPDGQTAYVTNSVQNTVSRLRTTTVVPVVTGTIPTGQQPYGVAVTPQGDRLLVANTGSNTVTIYDTATNGLLATVPVGIAPAGLAVRPQTVFKVQGSASPNPVQPGALLTYSFTYSNISPKSAANVALVASIPTNTSFVSATGGGAASGGQVNWTIGSLIGGGSGQVSFTVRVASPLAPNTQLTSTATMADDQAVTAQATVTSKVTSSPNYSIAKVESQDPVVAGNALSYTISYANNATANADGTGVTITETYDPNFIFVSSSPAPIIGTDNQWSIGALPVGASGTIQVNGTVRSPLANGTLLQNNVTIRDAAGKQASATQSTTTQSSPSLAIAVADDRDPVSAGGTINYSISYTNAGTENAGGVVITAAYDPNLTFVSATPPADGGTNNRWTIGNLNVGTNGTIVVTARVAPVVPNGTILSNQVQITSNLGAFATGAQSTTVSSAPSLSITLSDAPDPIATGNTLTYTVSYANTGSDAANNAQVVLSYDAGTSFISAVPPPSVGNNQWNLGNVPVGGSGTIVVQVQVNVALGAILNAQATISDSAGNSASSTCEHDGPGHPDHGAHGHGLGRPGAVG